MGGDHVAGRGFVPFGHELKVAGVPGKSQTLLTAATETPWTQLVQTCRLPSGDVGWDSEIYHPMKEGLHSEQLISMRISLQYIP